MLLKKKIILSERNDPYQNPGNKYIRRLRDVLYEFSDGIVFQTIDAKNYFSKSIQKKGLLYQTLLFLDYHTGMRTTRIRQ